MRNTMLFEFIPFIQKIILSLCSSRIEPQPNMYAFNPFAVPYQHFVYGRVNVRKWPCAMPLKHLQQVNRDRNEEKAWRDPPSTRQVPGGRTKKS